MAGVSRVQAPPPRENQLALKGESFAATTSLIGILNARVMPDASVSRVLLQLSRYDAWSKAMREIATPLK